MAEQLDLEMFTGAHPTNRELLARLADWGFTRRREEGVHVVFRGPGGGTLRVLRSGLGRADAAVVAKAARLAGVDMARFWAGPGYSNADETTGSGQRHAPASQDRITSIVLAAHTCTDRPLGFDQVVRLCGGRVTREQVRSASSLLCRDGQLDRIRSGVYQWAGGVRAPRHEGKNPARPAASTRAPAATTSAPAKQQGSRPVSAELFDLLFPQGVRITAEVLVEVEQWARLTEKLVKYADAS